MSYTSLGNGYRNPVSSLTNTGGSSDILVSLTAINMYREPESFYHLIL